MNILTHYLTRTCIALLTIWIGIVIYILLGAASSMLTEHHYEFVFWPRIRALSLYLWLPWLVMIPPALYFSEKFPLKPTNWVAGVFIHLTLFLLLTLMHGYAVAQAYANSGDITPAMAGYEAWQHTGHFLFLDDFFLFDAMIYIFLVASQNISNFYSLAQQKELDAARMQAQLTESRLQALLMQVNPHFLFNTLNSIAVLVRKNDTERAGSMIEKLSAFFRHTLDAQAEQWVPLKQELDMMDQYLGIEKVRIGPRFVVTHDISDAALSFPVPMLITQPLVENAMKHGIGRKSGDCELKIAATVRDKVLVLKITDTGAGCDFGVPQDGKRIGLNNVRERLRQIYGSDEGLRLDGIIGVGVTVTLELPYIRPPGSDDT